ncbi:UNVERIFIED_CONTAM: hypothetical protein Scaly_0092700 [Sesamum calycinum]|uniref:MULE transposase domain-containing protein n=1 Tax=Sesamum calycinum TaxID=2727403 RepID=A0AAW2SVF0_9LAMI
MNAIEDEDLLYDSDFNLSDDDMLFDDFVGPNVEFGGSNKGKFVERSECLKSGWTGKTFVKKFKDNPKLGISEFRNELCTTLKANVSKWRAYKAKKKAMDLMQGKMKEQFNKIWDYCEEIMRSNPSSTVRMKLIGEEGERKQFHRFYMCFNACKMGFINGCKPVVGVDGCFLKRRHGGQLLLVVGLDANNNIYPIAYAIVESETKNSWMWFLRLLDRDLGFENDHNWTFMSDKQKGLIPAFEALFPNAENRFCVRHLHSNMKKDGFTGLSLKQAMNEEPEAYVHKYYSIDAYKKCYELPIFYVNSSDLWPRSMNEPPLPPLYKEKVGRPQRLRRREPDEPPAPTSNPFRDTGTETAATPVEASQSQQPDVPQFSSQPIQASTSNEPAQNWGTRQKLPVRMPPKNKQAKPTRSTRIASVKINQSTSNIHTPMIVRSRMNFITLSNLRASFSNTATGNTSRLASKLSHGVSRSTSRVPSNSSKASQSSQQG